MKPETTFFIKTFLVSGSIFALLMAGFNYSFNDEFNIYKSLFHFVFFGLIMAFVSRNNLRKNKKNE